MKLRHHGKQIDPDEWARKHGKESFTATNGGESALFEVVSTVNTVDGVIAAGDIDLDEWDVERSVVNRWEVGAKNKAGTIEVTPLWQVKVWLKRKPINERKVTEEVIAAMEAHSPKYPKPPKRRKTKDKYLHEYCAMDLHYGKRAWAEETGENYTSKMAGQRLIGAVDDLALKLVGFPPARILLPIGNDFVNVDGPAMETAGGTRQDVDTRFHKMFSGCLRAAVDTIDRLYALAPVDVVILPGNHDKTATAHLGFALAAWYRNVKGVTVDNRPRTRKYYQYGNVLLGYCHGGRDDPAPAKLPLLMATEEPQLWASTHTHEWHLGHQHKKKEDHYNIGDTHNGVHVRRIESLSGTDAWHYEHGYVKTPKRAEAFVWHPELGYVGTFASYNAQ